MKYPTSASGRAASFAAGAQVGAQASNNILYVDDDPEALAAFRRMMQRQGVGVDVALGAHEALKAVEQSEYAVIATDLEMPDIGGLELIELVHRKTPKTTVVLVTGSSTLELPTESESAAAISCVVRKPWDSELMVAALRRGIALYEARQDVGNKPSECNGADILLVEDSDLDAMLVSEMLSQQGAYCVHHVTRLGHAIAALEERGFDAILTDLSLPDARGVDGVSHLQRLAPQTPLLVMSGSADEALALQAVKLGAQDYLMKDKVESETLRRALRYAIERKSTEQKLAQLAQFDQLTGLANRTTFYEMARRTIARAERVEGPRPAIMILDLDRFKSVNDTLGHEAGDILLTQVARRLQSAVRDSDWVARLGGDEFAVLVEDVSLEEHAAVPARRIIESLGEPVPVHSQELTQTTSIGIAVYPENGSSVEELVRNADSAMYRAKDNGRSTYQLFDRQMHESAMQKLELERDLESALGRGEFELYFQPVSSCRTGEPSSFEALLRWRHPRHGIVLPDQFINLLEGMGEIVPVGEWVLQTACKQMALWSKRYKRPLRVSVNVSPRQFDDPELVAKVARALATSGLSPASLELEITENMVMRDVEKAGAALRELRNIGVSVAIDDFGTGFTQFSCLVRYPLNTLKLDQSIVQTIGTRDGNTIAMALIEMAHNLQLRTVAEGVEEVSQLSFLQDNDCDFVQGYACARPMATAACGNWIESQVHVAR